MYKKNTQKKKIIKTTRQSFHEKERQAEQMMKELEQEQGNGDDNSKYIKLKLMDNNEQKTPIFKLKKGATISNTGPVATDSPKQQAKAEQRKVEMSFGQEQQNNDDQLNNSKTLKKEQIEQLKSLQQANMEETMPSGFMNQHLLEKKQKLENLEQQVTASKENLLAKMLTNKGKVQTDNQMMLLFQKASEESERVQKEQQEKEQKENELKQQQLILQQQQQSTANQDRKESTFQGERKQSIFSSRRDSFDNQSQASFTSKLSKFKSGQKKKMTKEEIKKQQQEEQKKAQNLKEQEAEEKRKEALQRKLVSAREANIIKVQATVKGYIQRKKYHRMLKKFKKLKYQNQVEQDLVKLQDNNIMEYYNTREKLFISDKYDIAFTQKKSTYTNLRKNAFFPVMFQALAEKGNLDILMDEKTDKQNKKRPGTADNNNSSSNNTNNFNQTAMKNNFFQTYQKPDIEHLIKPQINGIVKQSENPEISVIGIFLKKNEDKIPQIFLKNNFGKVISDFEETEALQNKEVRVFDKIGKLKGVLQSQEPDQQSVSYSDNFDKDSQEQSSLSQSLSKKQTQNLPNKLPKQTMKKSTSKQSLKDSVISEEDYLKESFIAESFAQSQVKESIQEDALSQSRLHTKSGSVKESINKMSDSKISESIRIDDDIHESQSVISEDLKGDSKYDSSLKKSKSSIGGIEEDLYQQSGSLSQYEDDKFESISEDQQSKEEKQLQYQQQSSSYRKSDELEQSGTILKKAGSPSFKKKVRFGESSPSQQLNLDLQQLKQSQLLQIQEDNENKQQIQTQQNQQNQQNQYEYVVQQIIPQQEYNVKVTQSMEKLIEKYKPLKALLEKDDRSLEFTREQMQIRKIESEIHELINKTQSITQKWQSEKLNNEDNNGQIYQRAEYLYSKFQVEFNKLLSTNTFSKKLSLLNDFAMFKENQPQGKQQENNANNNNNNKGTNNQQSGNVQVQQIIQKIELKQDILQQVLTQVLENLTTLRSTAFDFNQVKQMRERFDTNLEDLLKQQEIILKKQFEQQLDKRDSDLKNMLQIIIENQRKQQLIQGQVQYVQVESKKSKLQQLLDLNRDTSPQKQNYYDSGDEEEELLKQIKKKQLSGKQAKYEMKQYQDDEDDILQNEEFERLSLQQKKLMKKKLADDETLSFDMEADEKSNISWQDINLIDNINKADIKKMNNKSTDQIVKFLSNMLLEEIKNDLFPLRQNTATITQPHVSQEYIEEKSTATWKSPAHQQKNQTNSVTASEQSNEDNNSTNKSSSQNKDADSNENSQQHAFNRSEQETETKENEFSFGKKRASLQNSSFSNESEINSSNSNDNLPKSTEQGTINNQDLEKIEKVLDQCVDQLKKSKNKDQIIKNILGELQKNEKKIIPEFSGNVLSKQKLINESEIKQNNDPSIINSFELEVIAQIVNQIKESLLKKKETPNEMQEFVLKRFNPCLKSAKLKLLKSVKKLVPKDFYKDADVKPIQNFSSIYQYCNFNKPPIDDDAANNYLDYELEKNVKLYQNQVGGDVLDLIIQDMAKEFAQLQIKRQQLNK